VGGLVKSATIPDSSCMLAPCDIVTSLGPVGGWMGFRLRGSRLGESFEGNSGVSC
jgi:hypothetical protein